MKILWSKLGTLMILTHPPTRNTCNRFFCEIDAQAANTKALSKTREAIFVAQGNIQQLVADIPSMGCAMAMHFLLVLETVVGRLNHAASTIGNLALSMGDVDNLTAQHGYVNLVVGMMCELYAIIGTDNLENINVKVDGLDDRISDLNTDVGNRIKNAVVATT